MPDESVKPTAQANAAAPVVPYRPFFGGIFFLAFGTLLFEISLIRIFSFTIWHHFGYVVISTALLGFGASGTYLALRPRLGTRDLRGTIAVCALVAGVTMVLLLGFVWAAPLNPMSILDDPGQLALLVAYQIGAAIPFFFAGLAVTLTLRAGAQRVDRIYFWDLIGGGLGCLASVWFMNLVAPPGTAVLGAAALSASAILYADRRFHRLVGAALFVALVAGSGFAERIPFSPARSKELALLTNSRKATPVGHEWTALFRTDYLKASPDLNSMNWGISRSAPKGLESPAYYMCHDGTAGAGLYDLRKDSTLDWLPYHIFQFPYLISKPNPNVLVIGVGGGRDVVVAVQAGASHVTGAELDPVAIRFLREDLDDVSAGFFNRPEVDLVATEGRHFINVSDDRYDVIQLTGVDTLSAVNSGAYILSENYLYTTEAFHSYLDHLTPGGILSLAMANENPDKPRAGGRIVSVAQQVLRERGVKDPERHIAVIASGTLYVSVLIRTTPFDASQIDALARTASALGMDPFLLPGHKSHPVFMKLATLEGAAREKFLSGLRYRVDATTDNDPFFLSFFRWGDLFEPGKLTPSHSTALGQIVLGALLISLTVLGTIFILVPLVVLGRRHAGGELGQRLGVMGFFVSIGLGFMLFEISLIQRFVLFLGYPTYSLSVTLCSLLVFLGWGSYLSRILVHRHRQAIGWGVVAIALLAVFYAKGMPAVQELFFGSSIAVRASVVALLLAPLGLVMGIFFPLGIRVASAIHPDWVPWAWGINGCASVTAGVLAVVLAMTFGFEAVWALSVAIYALGATGLILATRSLNLEGTG